MFAPELELLPLQHQDPQTGAMLLRVHWRLGDKPIANMIYLLEAKGVRVFSLSENTKEVDAFSLWRDDMPYMFLNRFKSSERSRYDAAHELAHLCLHKHGGANTDHLNNNLEKEANSFAGAFLMPESDVRSIYRRPVYSVDDLAEYKKRWRVSVSAFNYRLHELRMISDGKCTSNFVEMSRRAVKWNRKEFAGAIIGFPRHHQELPSRCQGKNCCGSNGRPPGNEALRFALANMTTIDGGGIPSRRRNVELKLVN